MFVVVWIMLMVSESHGGLISTLAVKLDPDPSQGFVLISLNLFLTSPLNIYFKKKNDCVSSVRSSSLTATDSETLDLSSSFTNCLSFLLAVLPGD